MSLNINLNAFHRIESMPRHRKILEAALEYARGGEKIVPVYNDSKVPALENWSENASSDPKTITKWFGPDGPYAGYNIAILIDGFTVIDIDRHGDSDGFKTLGGALDAVPCPRAMTPNNGMHLLATVTDVKPGNGVDVLGKGKLFMVYPSEIGGRKYEWKSGGFPVPVKRIRAVEKTTPLPDAVGLAPAGYVREVLEYIDPDTDYGTWLKVGMAIHHNDAGPIGLEIWDEWSKQGSKYKDGECERRWETFDANRGKPTTMRWLIVEAVKNGKPASKEDLIYHGSLYHSLEIEKLNEKYGIYDLHGKMYVVYKENGVAHFSDPYNFKVKIADKKIEHDGKLKPLADAWLEHPDRRVIKDVGMWMPGKEPPDVLNCFEGLAVEPIPCEEEEVSFFLNFCRDVICDGVTKHYTYLMDLLARKLQCPLELTRICLVLQGGEGIGKGALTRTMENLIGPRHSVNVSSSTGWLGQYATLIKSAIWVSANEAHWSGNHSHGERLKALISEETIDLEEKYINIRSQKNRVMVAITTNNDWAVPAGSDSRRYFVLRVPNTKADDVEFWDEYHAKMGVDQTTRELNDPEFMGKLLYWFLNRKIGSNLKRAMETPWLLQQRQETAVDSRDEIFISWARAVFAKETQDDIIAGMAGYNYPIVYRSDGGKSIRTTGLYEDYRAYVSSNSRKPRMTLSNGMFTLYLSRLGMTSTRVRKNRVKYGNGVPVGNDEMRIAVMALPQPDEIEEAITQQFPLFAQMEIEDVDSDS